MLEVLFDWVDKSRPFFFRSTSNQKVLSDIVEPFLSPTYSRNSLCAAVKGKGLHLEFKNPFDFELRTLPVGTRVVFSFFKQLSSYSESFLYADRTADYSHWNFNSHSELRLPRVYQPSSPVTPKGQSGEISQLSFFIKNSGHNFILILKDSELWALEPKNWDEQEAFIRIPPKQSIGKVNWLGTGYKPDYFNIIREGQVEEVVWGKWEIKPISLPPELEAFTGKFSSYFPIAVNNSLYQLIDMNLWLQRPGSTPEKIYFTSEKGAVIPDQLTYLSNGAVVFADKGKRELFYGNFSTGYEGVNAKSIFGPVDHPSLSFCVDERGILYVTENDRKRLHVLLPASHWSCPACGRHGTNRAENERCAKCNALLPEILSESYYKWFDMDLSELGSRFGPLTIDSTLNLYIVVNDHNIVALPLEQKDFWGEENG